MVEVFIYNVDWEITEGPDEHVGKYGQFVMDEPDPSKALPLIMREVEAKWGKVTILKQFSGPRANHFYISSPAPEANV